MVEEAKLIETDGGLEPESKGWFVVNVRDTTWWRSDVFGASCPFEGNEDEKRRKASAADARFNEYGINIHVVWPGQSNCMYHGEDAQEDFLVLSGECLLLVEGEERPLRAWDFIHFPAWTEHVIVGAGSGPCAILMVGTRGEGLGVRYPVAEVAQKHGAAVEQETTELPEAYARFPRWERAPLENAGLPWQ
jgi:uncharacterized cupin superfamily protein